MTSRPVDDRDFVRVSTDMPSNRKIVDATPAVKWLYATGFCVAGRPPLTNGVVRPSVVVAEADVPSSAVKQLLRRGVWHAPGHDCERCEQPPKGHVVIHDYLLHNRSKDEADEQRRKKSEAGRKGAAARWGSDAARHGGSHDSSDSTCHDTSNGKPIAESESESERSVVTYLRQSPKQTRELSDDGLTKIKTLTKGDDAHARKVVEDVLTKASGDVRNVERYVLAAIRQEPELYRAAQKVTRETCCPKPGHESYLADHCGACAADAKAGTA